MQYKQVNKQMNILIHGVRQGRENKKINTMKKINLNEMALQQISENEMQETDGGLFPLLIIGCVVLLSSCVQTNQNNGAGTQINTQTNAQNTGDSVKIKNQGTLEVSPK